MKIVTALRGGETTTTHARRRKRVNRIVTCRDDFGYRKKKKKETGDRGEEFRERTGRPFRPTNGRFCRAGAGHAMIVEDCRTTFPRSSRICADILPPRGGGGGGVRAPQRIGGDSSSPPPLPRVYSPPPPPPPPHPHVVES